MEWVDTDGCVSAPQYCPLFITSVTKGIVASVSVAVEAAAHGTFKGGNYNGNLANDGVSLSPYHDFANKIPMSVQNEITQAQGWHHRREDLGEPEQLSAGLTRHSKGRL